ncbi:NitT/TauT family transport system substrate-binding protein [Afipia massiliensis]|uniref:NitT/TauT family transport system substrate-binding protein n=1 Tax=Afipia massiliensis TaxID=211460 RepID=A0A840N0N6_9BRAD|nr:ABC transporter substrate-binding protein [Afipia massiliensis]MBB5052600.1 NitT/TauT family transport system substrate-binding protein [Afipia massiliensis]
MPNTPYRLLRKTLLSLALLTSVCVGATPGSAASALHFSFDRAIDGAAAPFVLASVRGLFRTEGLTVTTGQATSSVDAIGRVASGSSDMALADINALVRYRDKDNGAAVKAVFVLYNKAPYAIIARKSRGIATMSDLEGKTIGIVDGDLAARLWPAMARLNNIKRDKIRTEKISAAVREPMLSAGQLDAVTGFSFLSAINLRDRGVPANDLAVLRFSDFGSEVYGHALIVNPKFADANPDAVKGFVRATIAGIRLSLKDPARAIDDVLLQMSGGSRDVELERLRAVLNDNIVTDEVKRNGLGGIEPGRFDAGISQIADDYEFRKRPSAGDIFDDSFLPPLNARKIN